MIPVTQQNSDGTVVSSSTPLFSTASDVENAAAAIVSSMKLSFLSGMIRDLLKYDNNGGELEFLADKSDTISLPQINESKLNDRPLNLCIRDQIYPKSRGTSKSTVQTCLIEIENCRDEEGSKTKNLSASSSLYQMRRRQKVSWKGLAVCAACCTAFNKMSDLNQHYSAIHKDLLECEWDAAIQKRARRHNKSAIKQMQRLSSSSPMDLSNAAFETSKLPLGAKLVSGAPSGQHGGAGSKGGLAVGHMCPSCNYCAKWPTELQKHIVVHATSRPFVCIICGNCYKWSWDLGRHFSAIHASIPNPYKFKRNLRINRDHELSSF